MLFLITTNVKDEHNIKEWIDYHLCMADRLLIWDDDSHVPVATHDPRVEVRRIHATKHEYMTWSVEHACRIGAEWTIHIDGDEYLYLGGETTPKFLARFRSDTISIYLPWLHFGSNHRVHAPEGSVIPLYTRCSSTTGVECKTMARSRTIASVVNPHLYAYHTVQTHENSVYADGSPMRDFSALCPEKSVSPPLSTTCCIAHYHVQSWDHFRRRRARPRDDTGKKRRFPFSLDSPVPPRRFHLDSNDMEFPHVYEFQKRILKDLS